MVNLANILIVLEENLNLFSQRMWIRFNVVIRRPIIIEWLKTRVRLFHNNEGGGG